MSLFGPSSISTSVARTPALLSFGAAPPALPTTAEQASGQQPLSYSSVVAQTSNSMDAIKLPPRVHGNPSQPGKDNSAKRQKVVGRPGYGLGGEST